MGREDDILETARYLLERTDKFDEPGYVGEFIVDSAFFFGFDREWTRRVREIRRRYMGREEPLNSKDEVDEWLKVMRNSSKFGQEYVFDVGELMAGYGLVDGYAVQGHILRGRWLTFAWTDFDMNVDQTSGLTYWHVRFYSYAAFALAWRRAKFLFPAYLESRHHRDFIAASLFGFGETIGRAGDLDRRIEAWVLGLLTSLGGGTLPFTDPAGQGDAVSLWDDLYWECRQKESRMDYSNINHRWHAIQDKMQMQMRNFCAAREEASDSTYLVDRVREARATLPGGILSEGGQSPIFEWVD